MGKRKMKLSVEERVIAVKKVLNREVGLNKAAKEAKVSRDTIKNWRAIYENEGPTGLVATKRIGATPKNRNVKLFLSI
ncbi:helix-turn-helix domain-containing protein [Enterococcus avium]|uniref:helix-turn-helix domain-containing protein n=1 Tax=Enterococcus avium TaxID=33945 RepID=UPI0018A92501|nr:helix-turn-helix domain-containing protein [Enterococcus avium]MDB1724623.1 helix-turn-helix domain-containing protein [Enterococcus avium]